jgi:hypothetical protein
MCKQPDRASGRCIAAGVTARRRILAVAAILIAAVAHSQLGYLGGTRAPGRITKAFRSCRFIDRDDYPGAFALATRWRNASQRSSASVPLAPVLGARESDPNPTVQVFAQPCASRGPLAAGPHAAEGCAAAAVVQDPRRRRIEPQLLATTNPGVVRAIRQDQWPARDVVELRPKVRHRRWSGSPRLVSVGLTTFGIVVRLRSANF